MAENMSVEQPKPTPKPEQVAERWMRMKGVPKLIEPKPAFTQNPTQMIGEAYDLFVEKQTLQDDIVRKQREVMEPKPTTPPLTLEQKRQLIKAGKIGTVLQSVSSAEPFGEVVTRSQVRTAEIDGRLGQIFSTPGMYEKFHQDLSRQVRLRHQVREVRSLDRFAEQADILALKLTREAQVQGRALTSIEEQFIRDNQALIQETQQRRHELLKDPEVFDRVRIIELQEFKRQLQQDRFAETQSRKEYLRKIEQAWAEAKKVLLTGGTGTGKTEMLKHASRMLFGVLPESVTGHQDMSIYELLGKTGFDMKEGDKFRPSGLLRAWEGRGGKGQPFMFDEIDRAPNQAIMGIKTVFNARPGEKGMKVQTDSGQSFNIGPDYAFAGTANIKSEKHATATELDPAIVRVFDAPMDIDYMSAPEVYDLALASLLDQRGGIPLSESDAKVILKNLCDAASWIQDAYQGKQVVTDPASGSILAVRGQASTGGAASLSKALLDPGRTLDMLQGWTTAKVNAVSFEGYLNQRIAEFINNRAYPGDDRYYLTEIFALKGFLRGKKVHELMVPGLTQDVLDRWSGAGGQGGTTSAATSYLTADRVAKLDPYRRFKRPASADAQELLEEEEAAEQRPATTDGLVRFQAVKDIVGDVSSWAGANKGTHHTYINKVYELGDTSASLADRKEAIRLLKEYGDIGVFSEASRTSSQAIDYLKSLRAQAREKAAKLRARTINEANDLDTILEYTGEFTEFAGKEVHYAFINKVHDIGMKSRDPNQMQQIADLLERYVAIGAYSEANSSNTTAIDYLKSLRAQAREKAVELKNKMLTSV